MGIFRRNIAFVALLIVAGSAFSAKPYPEKIVKIVVGYPPGGTLDNPARALAQELSRVSGQTFIIENRPGASANIAADLVAKSQPDGYTLLLSSSALASSPTLYKSLSYSAQTDFRHVGGFSSLPTLIVARKDFPADDLADAVALAKKSPGKYTFGSPGNGTGAHIAGEVLNKYAGTKINHIPFKGAAPALQSIVGGHIDFMIAGLSTLEGAVKNKQVKVLAVTNAEPAPALTSAPTIQHALKGVAIPVEYQFSTWLGLSAPANTPEPVVKTLQDLMVQALSSAKLKRDFTEMGVMPGFVPGPALAAQIEKETQAYLRVVKDLGITAD
ncbi:MAG: tripartite tricarboxylate transporter substrate binding protein [Comamonadaceae bacterium]|nr:tripartite tricarboxylate transporter substrate binding protein [Comamonadaceae bacterium]